MMNVENFVDTDLLNRLEYGKLYVFINDAHKADAYKTMLLSKVRYHQNAEWISKTTIELVQVPNVDRLGMVIAARKFNAGNIGRYSVLACIIQNLATLDDGLLTFHNRLTSVEEDEEYEDSKFTLIFPELGIASEFASANSMLFKQDFLTETLFSKDERGYDCKASPSLLAFEDALYIDSFDDDDCAELTANEYVPSQKENAQLEIIREAERESEYVDSLQQQRDHDLQLIQALIMDFIQKYQADPTELIATTLQGKYIVNTTPMLVVNRDRKIIFPEYNEMELKMSAASRTLYIWFLKHPEGCRLSELSDYRDELIEIYEEVHPGCNYLEESVDAMLERSKINQNFSRIKKMVRSVIVNDDIAQNYFISGERGGIYRLPIAADSSKVRFPKSLMQ